MVVRKARERRGRAGGGEGRLESGGGSGWQMAIPGQPDSDDAGMKVRQVSQTSQAGLGEVSRQRHGVPQIFLVWVDGRPTVMRRRGRRRCRGAFFVSIESTKATTEGGAWEVRGGP